MIVECIRYAIDSSRNDEFEGPADVRGGARCVTTLSAPGGSPLC
jgi:hypothetical protein